MHAAIKRSILASGLFEGQGRSREVNMLAEMVAYGDSGAFLDKVRPCGVPTLFCVGGRLLWCAGLACRGAGVCFARAPCLPA